MTTSTPNEQFKTGRATAAALIADAYERALATLHSQDVQERDWYEAQRRDARVVAGPADGPVIALTRAEARAVAGAFSDTRGGFDLQWEEHDRALARGISVEFALREGGGWWGDNDPAELHSAAFFRGTHCPDSFPMSAAGLAVIVETLPEMVAKATEDHERNLAELAEQGLVIEDCIDSDDAAWSLADKQALLGLAARLGVEIPAQEAVS